MGAFCTKALDDQSTGCVPSSREDKMKKLNSYINRSGRYSSYT